MLALVNTQPVTENTHTPITMADRMYKLTGQDDFLASLRFLQSRPLLRKQFEKYSDGDTFEYWIHVYHKEMTDEQRAQAQQMTMDAKHKLERANAESYYY